MNNTRLATLLATKSSEHVKKIMELRQRFNCLMELPRERVAELQTKAVFYNYIQGEGRRINGDGYTFSSITPKFNKQQTL